MKNLSKEEEKVDEESDIRTIIMCNGDVHDSMWGGERLFVFEAPVDLLSFLCLFKKEWQKQSLSLIHI